MTGKHFFPNTDPPQALSFFPWAEHQLSKPDVVSQLEEEEELLSVERGISQDTFSGENQAHGSPAGNGLTGWSRIGVLNREGGRGNLRWGTMVSGYSRPDQALQFPLAPGLWMYFLDEREPVAGDTLAVGVLTLCSTHCRPPSPHIITTDRCVSLTTLFFNTFTCTYTNTLSLT